MNLLTYFTSLFKVKKEIEKQKSFNRRFLIPYIKTLEAKYNGIFSAPQLKKVLNYYGLFIPSVLCASYKRLYGKTLSEEERKRVTLFGILTPVGDDLFDTDKLDVESIRTITFTPEQFEATTFTSNVAKEIQQYLLQSVLYKEQYIKAAKDVFEIQLQTIRQTNPSITTEEITEITYAKGGYSVIIYHQTLDETASPEMLEALFYIGSLMQFANDCFDIYKDVQDGIYTLASRCSDYGQLKQIYIARVREANRSIMALPYSKSRKEEFCVIMHAIISQGLVAINQMIRLQKRLGTPVDCKTLERKELICDMQKPANVARWMYYAWQLPRLK